MSIIDSKATLSLGSETRKILNTQEEQHLGTDYTAGTMSAQGGGSKALRTL